MQYGFPLVEAIQQDKGNALETVEISRDLFRQAAFATGQAIVDTFLFQLLQEFSEYQCRRLRRIDQQDVQAFASLSAKLECARYRLAFQAVPIQRQQYAVVGNNHLHGEP